MISRYSFFSMSFKEFSRNGLLNEYYNVTILRCSIRWWRIVCEIISKKKKKKERKKISFIYTILWSMNFVDISRWITRG